MAWNSICKEASDPANLADRNKHKCVSFMLTPRLGMKSDTART